MEKVILKAEIREEFGKELNSKIRKSGAVPAVVYKKGENALALQVDAKALFHALHTAAGGNVIITLEIDSKGKTKVAKQDKTVIIKEIQYHPIKNDILHLDFHEISLTDKINVDIAIETKGEPEGVRNDGGTLDHPLKEINIECLPTDIPERIDVPVESLKMGETIRVKDLVIPAGVTVLTDLEQAVCSVVHPKAEEEITDEEAASEEAAEPEIIREKKPEDDAEVSKQSEDAPKK